MLTIIRYRATMSIKINKKSKQNLIFHHYIHASRHDTTLKALSEPGSRPSHTHRSIGLAEQSGQSFRSLLYLCVFNLRVGVHIIIRVRLNVRVP
jgi:hypothetical protein